MHVHKLLAYPAVRPVSFIQIKGDPSAFSRPACRPACPALPVLAQAIRQDQLMHVHKLLACPADGGYFFQTHLSPGVSGGFGGFWGCGGLGMGVFGTAGRKGRGGLSCFGTWT